jgi:ribonuclease T2
VRWLAVIALLAAAPLHAQAYQCRVPAKVSVPQVRPEGPRRRVPVTGYTLALSWAPEFCKGREGNRGDAIECSGANGRFGLIVHGLWPEGARSSPQWCPSRQALSPDEAQRNLCMVPSVRMQATEWAKHGACMSPDPARYFKVTRILYQGLRLPDLDRLSRVPTRAGAPMPWA